MWWTLGTSSYIFLNMIFYPALRDQGAELQKTLESLPPAAVQLFGGSTDFLSPIGFMNSKIFFMMLPLILAALAISLGANIVAKEEQDHTIDSLLIRPISRTRFLLSKALTAKFILAIVSIGTLLFTLVVARLINLGIPYGNIITATFMCYLFALTCGAIAFMIASTGWARSASIGITSAVAFGGYIVSSLSGSITWLKIPAKIFPFHYYNPESNLRGHISWYDVLYFVIIIIICAFISWLSFRKRDLA